MLHIEENPAADIAQRKQDISGWQDIKLDLHNAKSRKRFNRRKAAIIAYFTTEKPVEELATEHHIPPEQFLKLVESCLMRDEDGQFWGFRALVPGATIVDHVLPATNGKEHQEEEAAAEQTTRLSSLKKEAANGTGPAITAPLEATELQESSEQAEPEATTEQADPVDQESVAEEIPAEDAEITAPDVVEHPDTHVVEMPDKVDQTAEDSEPTEPLLDNIKLAPEQTEATAEEEITQSSVDLATTTSEATTTPENAQATSEETEPGGSAEAIAKVTDSVDLLPAKAEESAELLAARSTSLAEGCLRRIPLRRVLRTHDLLNLRRVAQQRRIVRRRLTRTAREKNKRSTFYRVTTLAIAAVMLFCILIPVGVGLEAYNLYNSVNGIAHDGLNQLLGVKDLLSSAKSDPMSALSTDKLKHAKTSFQTAEDDFLQLQQLVDRQDIQALANQASPQYGKQLVSAQHLVQVALDVSRMGQELTDVGQIGANVLHGSPLADSANAKPLLSVDDASSIYGAVNHTLYYLDDIQFHMSKVQMNDLPINKAQKEQLTGLLSQLPEARKMLVDAQSLLPPIFWLLGVGHERNFLIQTMDRGEMRPGGGFTGQYGVLTVQDGRISPFTLQDVALLDYGGNDTAIGRQAPAAYHSWMNFGNWGLRDSNVSPDYPTTAKINIQVFQEEGGGPVDGDIAFTPTFIGHILEVTGPLHVGDSYNETITAQNLEDRLHFYEEDNQGIAKQHQITGDTSHQGRKQFTTLLGKMLMDKVRHLPTKDLVNVVKNMTKDLESHDLQIYFTDPTAQRWLTDHNYGGTVDPFKKSDGFVLNQANISISKASTMVHTTEHDDITLDAQGGATHNLTVTLDYKQTGNVYGFDTYADYMRLYAPSNAQFNSGSGFDSGSPLCTVKPPTPPGGTNPPGKPKPPVGDNPPDKQGDNSCAKYNTSFPSDARYCPNGNYALGDRNKGIPWSINNLGGPTSKNSDLGGHTMWGGLTLTPKNCITTVTFSWYVPNAVKHDSKGHLIYQVLVQKQGGMIPTIELNVDASALKGAKSFQVKEDLKADKLFSMPS